jgi:hypothetical protein
VDFFARRGLQPQSQLPVRDIRLQELTRKSTGKRVEPRPVPTLEDCSRENEIGIRGLGPRRMRKREDRKATAASRIQTE